MQAQLFRVPAIVGIEQRDVGRTRLGNSAVSSTGEAPVGLGDDADALVIEAVHDFHRSVLPTVVDDDQFEIGEGLRQNGLDGFGHIVLNIVDGHHDGNFRIGHW